MRPSVQTINAILIYEASTDSNDRLLAAFEMLLVDTEPTTDHNEISSTPFDKNSVSNIMHHDRANSRHTERDRKQPQI